jgi:hypothetical protein
VSRKLPPQVLDAFDALASAQRGAPERAMLRAQQALGGGVYSYAIEHAGDLTNRGWQRWHLTHLDSGEEYIDDKARKVLRTLRHPYGFGREHRENMAANRSDPRLVKKRLQEYAEAHMKLPVYNAAQFAARDVAIALGKQNLLAADRALAVLVNMLDYDWDAHAKRYKLAPDGYPVEWKVTQDWWYD